MQVLTASAGVKFRTRPFTSSGERIMHGVIPASGAGTAGPVAGSIIPFRAFHVSVALVPDIFPSKVYDVTDSPVPVGCAVSSDVADLCTRVEVLVTGSSATSSHAKA